MRDLFFPPPVFEPLDGDTFILQVQGVFTRICSGAALVEGGGGVCGNSNGRSSSRGDRGGKLEWIYSSSFY
jgi:hypothetical protein